jgi:hypothetical protein
MAKYKTSNDMKEKIDELMDRFDEGNMCIDDLHSELLYLYNVTPRFFVALVYQNTEATMLRTLVTKSENKDEALGKAIEYFAEETRGYGLVMKTVTSPNEG